MVLQTDFFVTISDAQTIYCATFLSTKEKRYGEISIFLLPGWGSPAVPWRANAGVGWKGKMKLRFVKFFTSRENEIEKKEKEDGATMPVVIPPARGQSLCSTSSSRHHFPFLFLHPAPPARLLRHSLPPPRVGRAMSSSYLRHSRSASSFLLHKITEAEERGWKNRGGAPTLPTQLSYSTITWRRPARRHPCPFIQSGGRGPPSPNDILSAADEAIGKQSMKMNYPVSSPSLTNK